MKTIWALVVLPLVALTVNAQESVTNKLTDYMQQPEVMERTQQILVQDERKFTPKCTDLKSLKPVTISVFRDVNWDVSDPISGAWMARYEMDVCGTKRLRSIMYRHGEEGVEMFSLLPGNTQADPQLQNDVTKAFKLAIVRGYPDCQTPYIADTRLLSRPENGEAPWEELWVANVCGNMFGQAIRFVPQENGTAFALDIATDGQKAAE